MCGFSALENAENVGEGTGAKLQYYMDNSNYLLGEQFEIPLPEVHPLAEVYLPKFCESTYP